MRTWECWYGNNGAIRLIKAKTRGKARWEFMKMTGARNFCFVHVKLHKEES